MSHDFSQMTPKDFAALPVPDAQERMARAKDRLDMLTGKNRVEDPREVEAISCRINGTVMDREILAATRGGHAADVYQGFLCAAQEQGLTREGREQMLVQAHHTLTCVASLDPQLMSEFDWNEALEDTLIATAPFKDGVMKSLPTHVEMRLLDIFADQIENGCMTVSEETAERVAELPQSWGFNLFEGNNPGGRHHSYETFSNVRVLVDRLTPKAA